jgi:cobalt-zinc-cadmium efflux system outer membrane protein
MSLTRSTTSVDGKATLGLYRIVWGAILAAALLPGIVRAQTTLTWEQIKAKFEAANPTLKANQANIEESKAEEITAFLRPNPEVSLAADGTQITPLSGVWQPIKGTTITPGASYLHERQHKRELRRDTQKENTAITQSTYTDQERSLIFNLRSAFVQVLQSKAVLENARQNLAYWDRELDVNRTRLDAGDLAQVDFDRLMLQRVQFESDYETALVNLRTSKIQLLTLLNDRTPIEQFDVTGPYDFTEQLMPLEDFRTIAVAMRPDLKEAMQSVELAKLNYKLAVANGSTDPTFSFWYTHNGSWNNPNALNTIGASISIPVRVFDRNQGEKLRTQLDIGRNEQLQAATQAGVFSDVDSAYWTLIQNVNLLKPYKGTYLPLATAVRDRTTFSFQNGGASLLDFLDAEKAYRDTQLAYLNLIGSYLTAAAQMNMAVGQEVLQ